jgi:hypothetical protein
VQAASCQCEERAHAIATKSNFSWPERAKAVYPGPRSSPRAEHKRNRPPPRHCLGSDHVPYESAGCSCTIASHGSGSCCACCRHSQATPCDPHCTRLHPPTSAASIHFFDSFSSDALYEFQISQPVLHTHAELHNGQEHRSLVTFINQTLHAQSTPPFECLPVLLLLFFLLYRPPPPIPHQARMNPMFTPRPRPLQVVATSHLRTPHSSPSSPTTSALHTQEPPARKTWQAGSASAG